MKRIICKNAVFLLLVALLFSSLAGCARESDEAFLSTAEALLQKTAAVNEICFGKGLAFGGDGAYVTSGYVEATKEAREKYGVNTVDELKALIRSVYSVATCDYIDTVIFNPVKNGETGYLSYRRYFDAMDGDGNVCLMVKKEYEPLATGEVSYTNVRLSSHGRSRAEILVDITVSDGENTRTDRDVLLSLRYEDGGWKYDTVTYSSLK